MIPAGNEASGHACMHIEAIEYGFATAAQLLHKY